MLFIPVMLKLNIQHPLLPALVSHDPSEFILKCLFAAQQTYYYQC